ncbi:MAG: MarR family transcriptional regulator [Bacteroidia bacterium]|nr:MarR family transcriptional regulator [Bacteroidia bacterium]
MTLENDIKQKRPFTNQFQKAMVNIVYTSNWLSGNMKSFFSKHDITQKQFNIMRILKGAGEPVSTSYIKERMLDRNSDVSRIVDRMNEKTWIMKSTCPHDKRLVDVELTPKGIDKLNELNSHLEGADIYLSKLNDEEINLLNRLLDKIRE